MYGRGAGRLVDFRAAGLPILDGVPCPYGSPFRHSCNARLGKVRLVTHRPAHSEEAASGRTCYHTRISLHLRRRPEPAGETHSRNDPRPVGGEAGPDRAWAGVLRSADSRRRSGRATARATEVRIEVPGRSRRPAASSGRPPYVGRDARTEFTGGNAHQPVGGGLGRRRGKARRSGRVMRTSSLEQATGRRRRVRGGSRDPHGERQAGCWSSGARRRLSATSDREADLSSRRWG